MTVFTFTVSDVYNTLFHSHIKLSEKHWLVLAMEE